MSGIKGDDDDDAFAIADDSDCCFDLLFPASEFPLLAGLFIDS